MARIIRDSIQPGRGAAPRRPACHLILILNIALLAGLVSFALSRPAWAQPPADGARRFVIGFLPEGSDLPNAPVLLDELSRTLLAEKPLRAALERAGYDTREITLSPADGSRDLAQRMAAGEFDLVFATPVAYARQLGSLYEPVLQTWRRGDLTPPTREGGVHRQGVIIIGPRNPLFEQLQPPSREDKIELLRRAHLAVPSGESAAGYIAPRLMMTRELGLANLPAPLFCGSDEEVIKHVVAGLVEVGACSEEALAQLDLPARETNPYYRVLVRPEYPMPTDPILLRREFLPERSDLGRELVAALRQFFISAPPALTSGLRLENASRRGYEQLAGYLNQIEGSAPAPALAPSPTGATPTPTPTPEPSPTPAEPAPAEPSPGAPRPALPEEDATAPAETPAPQEPATPDEAVTTATEQESGPLAAAPAPTAPKPKPAAPAGSVTHRPARPAKKTAKHEKAGTAVAAQAPAAQAPVKESAQTLAERPAAASIEKPAEPDADQPAPPARPALPTEADGAPQAPARPALPTVAAPDKAAPDETTRRLIEKTRTTAMAAPEDAR